VTAGSDITTTEKPLPMLALSIVSPHGTNIVEGRKTLEVRSWEPAELPLRNLLIVENRRYLTDDQPEDEEGIAVAIVDVLEVHEWHPSETEDACSSGWQPGYKAWVLSNVRRVSPGIRAPAKRKLYQVNIGQHSPSTP
jgi:hypothetical protein